MATKRASDKSEVLVERRSKRIAPPPGDIEGWVEPKSWAFRRGDSLLVRTHHGDFPCKVVIIGNHSKGDQCIVVELDDQNPDLRTRIQVNKLIYVLVRPEFNERDPQYVEIQEEPKEEVVLTVPKDKDGNGSPAVTIKKMAPETAEGTSEALGEVKPARTAEVVKKNSEDALTYSLNMQDLSRATGISVITLRKYTAKYLDRIPHRLNERGHFMFSRESAEVVTSIKASNLAPQKS